MNEAMDYVLAQVNIGRLLAPLDSAQLAGFVAALDPVNAVADAAPGFVWRLQTEEGNATSLRAFDDEASGADSGILINMSVWESVEDRMRHLRQHGPTPYAFTLRTHFPPPGSDGDPGSANPAGASPLHSPEDWACPV
jgi:Domain of unknown function (DUF3291)